MFHVEDQDIWGDHEGIAEWFAVRVIGLVSMASRAAGSSGDQLEVSFAVQATASDMG